MQQKFSIPVACLVFALVGLALGMSVARDGKLAGFVVGIAVIFAYYVVFLLAESVTKGHYADPDAVKNGGRFIARPPRPLGPQHRPGHVRSRGPDVASPVHGGRPAPPRARRHPPAAGRLAAARRCLAPRAGRTRRPRARPCPVIVIRIPHLHLPLRGLIDRYISRMYLRVVGLSFLALLGLFYISTFIDKSDKIFKGQATTGTVCRCWCT